MIPTANGLDISSFGTGGITGPTELKTRVILVGIGGATCSGKTTLAKHLRRILPNSVIIHQDDFRLPEELIPIHPKWDIPDWDTPSGAADWPRFASFLQQVKRSGEIPPDYRSNEPSIRQKRIPVPDEVTARWKDSFERLELEMKEEGKNIVWGLVDGFLLYWNKDVIDQMDIRIFLRLPHDMLKRRRDERHAYHNAVRSDPEQPLWQDPPHYWERIVYPAYAEAHSDLFEDGDIEHGKPTGQKVKNLVLVEGLEIEMSDMVEKCCNILMVEAKQQVGNKYD